MWVYTSKKINDTIKLMYPHIVMECNLKRLLFTMWNCFVLNEQNVEDPRKGIDEFILRSRVPCNCLFKLIWLCEGVLWKITIPIYGG